MINNKLSLLDAQRTVKIPTNLINDEPAHVSRYLITALLIKQITRGNPRAKVLDVGGKKGLLREFGIKSTIIDMEESDEKDYIRGDALDMPFADNSFDVVVSCDVLEHIPGKDRDKFVAEMVRVSNGYVVIGAPFDQGQVASSEKAANQFYEDIAKKDHRWLIEHIENGLPDRAALEAYLTKQKLHHNFFKHLSLDVWDMTTRIHFLVAAYGDSKNIQALMKETYAKYYKELCDFDYSENGYRTFCLINKNNKFSFELPDVEKQRQAKLQYQIFLGEQLLASIKGFVLERHGQIKENTKLVGRIAQLEDEIRDITNSKSWKLAQKISKTRNFYK